MEDKKEDFEVNGLKSNGKDWDVIMKKKKKLKIEN